MYNIFITTKNSPRKLVAQVEDPRVFLRKHYSVPPQLVSADVDHSVWVSAFDKIEAHRIVEQIFEVPVEVSSQKEPPKTKREPGQYWCDISEPDEEESNWIICLYDGQYWSVPGHTRNWGSEAMKQINEHRLERQEYIQRIGRMNRVKAMTPQGIQSMSSWPVDPKVPGDERAYAGDLGKVNKTPEQIFEEIKQWLSVKSFDEFKLIWDRIL